MKLTLFLALSAFAFSQQGQTGEATAPIHHESAKPSISPEARAKYWRTVADLQGAKRVVETSEGAVKAAIDALTKECGGATLIAGADGEPTCAPKPATKPVSPPAE